MSTHSQAFCAQKLSKQIVCVAEDNGEEGAKSI